MNTDPRSTADWLAAFGAQYGITTGITEGSLAAKRAESAIAYAAEHVPTKFAAALPTLPAVKQWVADVAREAIAESYRRGQQSPQVHTGPSLLLTGITGVGKTFEAYGALRVLNLLGIHARWQLLTAPDLYARLRPRHGIDSEAEFRSIVEAPVLVVDDLAAEADSGFIDKVNLRLVNHRYDWARPTIFTSNLPPKDLSGVLDDRTASRLREMTRKVAYKGEDRRRSAR